MTLQELDTPCLLLDRGRLERNAARMLGRARKLGVRLRPHVKTTKSDDIAKVALGGATGPVTVSTLHEAEYVAAHGYDDILYAVCVSPDKLDRVARLTGRGVAVQLIVDSIDAARAISAHPGHHTALVEVDCGEHRTGVLPEASSLLAIAQALHAGPRTTLMGVMTHAGHSYACRDVAAIRAVATAERDAAVHAAERLRSAGLPCPIVSVGSTPTATHVEDLSGVTDMRPGVYLLGDLFQAGIQSCNMDDIACAVLATVISHQHAEGRIIIDAGGLGLSKDRSTDGASFDAGYGLVASAIDGRLLDGLRVGSVHQEHGEITVTDPALFEAHPIGSKLRVLPNHICMTAAMYDRYHLVDQPDGAVTTWFRTNGWRPYEGSPT